MHDLFHGGLISTFFIYVCCLAINVCVFDELYFNINNYWFIPVLLINIYIQWKDEFMSEFITNYSEKENYEIVIKTLNNLNWLYFKKYDEIKLKNSNNLNFLDVTIIVRSKKIYYNFKYDNMLRSGKPSFVFGLSTLIERIFLNKLKKEMLKKQMLNDLL